MKRILPLLMGITALVLAIFGGRASSAQDKQDKYSLKSPDGIAFSDFRGYEDWSTVSSARQAEVLKVIVANSAMIKAFKSGVPLNGKAFPEGSMIAKLSGHRRRTRKLLSMWKCRTLLSRHS